MKQIHLTGDAYFQDIIKAFDMHFLNGGKIDPGQIIPHRNLQMHDYVFRHTLTPTAPSQSITVVTRQGWIFISTGILVEYDGNFNSFIPSVKLEVQDTATPNFSGSSYGGYYLKPQDFQYLPARCDYGPGPDSQFMTEPRDFLRHIGEGGVLNSTAKLDPSDTLTRRVNVIVTGWEIKI